MKKKTVIFFLLIIVINSFANFIYAIEGTLPTFAIVEKSSDVVAEDVKVASNSVNFNFQSKSQILIEMSTGKVIYENNADEKAYPASVTKIMTLLLIMEAIDSGKLTYEDKITCSENASKMGGSQIWFKVGEEITVDEALKSICVVSANDVCVAMAEHIAGSEENFVNMMNNKAKELKMDSTNFVNCHGIDDENHYTTARDISIMSRELMNNHKDITKYTTIWMDSIRNGTFNLSNTNKLIRYYDGATGLKTGYTQTALYNLSATATKNNMNLCAVVLTAPSSDIRNEEAKQLLNYGFANFELQTLGSKDEVVDKVNVNKALNCKVELVLKDDVKVLNEKGKNIEIKKNIELDEKIKAPVSKGSVVGKISYADAENNVIGTSDIIINKDVKKSNVLQYIKYSFNIFLMCEYNKA